MKRSVLYLVVGVLLQTASECSGLEWEFGSNLGGSKIILEKEGVIPAYAREKRVQINTPKCTDVVYVKVEVEDMPTVTYNIDIKLVIIKFGKGFRSKTSEFRVSAKGVKTESAKCGGSTTPMSPTRYADGQNPYIDGTPYFQFSKEYFPRDTENVHPPDAHQTNAHPYDAHPTNAYPHDAYPHDAYPHDAHPTNAYPHDAHQNNEHPYDAHQNNAYPHDAHSNDAHQYNEYPHDAHQNNEYPHDAHSNDAQPHNAHQNNEYPHDAHPNDAHSQNAYPDNAHPGANSYDA